MSTLKKRLNITLPDDIDKTLLMLAKRDQMPQATKAVYLLRQAIEIDEDDVFNTLAEQRDTAEAKFISHKDAWK